MYILALLRIMLHVGQMGQLKLRWFYVYAFIQKQASFVFAHRRLLY